MTLVKQFIVGKILHFRDHLRLRRIWILNLVLNYFSSLWRLVILSGIVRSIWVVGSLGRPPLVECQKVGPLSRVPCMHPILKLTELLIWFQKYLFIFLIFTVYLTDNLVELFIFIFTVLLHLVTMDLLKLIEHWIEIEMISLRNLYIAL